MPWSCPVCTSTSYSIDKNGPRCTTCAYRATKRREEVERLARDIYVFAADRNLNQYAQDGVVFDGTSAVETMAAVARGCFNLAKIWVQERDERYAKEDAEEEARREARAQKETES